MTETSITIPIDTATAHLYHRASPTDQQTIQLLLRLRLRELTTLPHQSLREIMDEIGAKAVARGLTAERLEELLGDE